MTAKATRWTIDTVAASVILWLGTLYCVLACVRTIGGTVMGQQMLWDEVNRAGLTLSGGHQGIQAKDRGTFIHMSSEEARNAEDGTVIAAQVPTVTGLRFCFVKDSSRPSGGLLVRKAGLGLGDRLPMSETITSRDVGAVQ